MVRIRKRRKGNREYFVLEHSRRIGRKIVKKEKSLGPKIPDQIERIKAGFWHELYLEEWLTIMNCIKQRHNEETTNLPESVLSINIENFMIQFTYSTNRIEGGTLTQRETASLLQDNITPGDRPLSDVLETKNHKELFYLMFRYEEDLNYRLMEMWHRLLLKDTKVDIAGKVRDWQVQIIGSDHVPPSPVEVIPCLNDLFEWYHEEQLMLHPVELAALFHYKFVAIHPFGDGNGRIARIFMNFILKRNDYPLINIEPKQKRAYLNALDRSDRKKNPYEFVRFLTKHYISVHKKRFGC